MPSPLSSLEPRSLWVHFDAIRQIPRPSRQEERILAHVLAWARAHGFGVRRDAAGNLAVDVPASPGLEHAGGVVLQAHLDMVCEKNAGTEHDFQRDPIEVAVEDGWVRAVGTTLGADNGIGVAAAMAIADDAALVHGPLELLFTLDEETGLNGARRLEPALVRGRWLINLDTEEDGALYIGCAGAAGITARLALERRGETAHRAWQLAVRGLRGGHSGLEIALPHANALKVIRRVLQSAHDAGLDPRLITLEGGSKPNAIAREAFAHLELAGDGEALERWLARERSALATELGTLEPGLRLELEPADPHHAPLAAETQRRLLELLETLPHGPLAFSREMPGLVETSVNLAVLGNEGATAALTCSLRSSVESERAATLAALETAARRAGAEVETHPGYPGWKPEPDAPLVRKSAAVFERLFGRRPEIKAVHAGLECGILIEKVPRLGAVSIGPEIRGAHSPDERVEIASVGDFYRHLHALVAALAETAT